MNPTLKIILFGLGVFAVFTTLAVLLKLFTHQAPHENAYFGIITNGDILLGLLVAVFVTFSHERKKRIK